MKLRALVLAGLVLLVAYIGGGNLYLRVQVKSAFNSRLSQWEEKTNRGLPPDERIKVEVEDIKPSFTPLPFLSPYQSFMVRGIRCSFPRGVLSVAKLVGTARTSLGGMKGIKISALEGLKARALEGGLDLSIKGLVFTPVLDLSLFLERGGAVRKVIGGRAEGIALSFIDRRGGKVDLAVEKVSFREEMDLREEKGALPGEPFKSRFLLERAKVGYHALDKGKGGGEAYLDYVDVDTALKRGASSSYTFRERLKTELSRLELASGKGGNEKVDPRKILPLKASFEMELTNLSEGLVSSVMEILRTYQGGNMDQRQRLVLMLQFLPRILPPLMAATLKGKASFSFPGQSSLTFRFQEPIAGMLRARRWGNALWVTVEVRGKERLLSLLTQAGFRGEGLERFFSGFVCQGDVCKKKIPLGRGSSRS